MYMYNELQCTCTCTMYPTIMINYSCCIAGHEPGHQTFQLILILKVWHFSVDGICNWYCSYKMTRDL